MTVGGSENPASVFQALNPIYILLFGIVFSALWTFLGNRGPGCVQEGRDQGLVLLAGREGDRGHAGHAQHDALTGDHPQAELVQGRHGVTSLRSGGRRGSASG